MLGLVRINYYGLPTSASLCPVHYWQRFAAEDIFQMHRREVVLPRKLPRSTEEETVTADAIWRACGIASEPAAREIAAKGGHIAGHSALPPGDVDVRGQGAHLHSVQTQP